ncbi:hypothetical protein BRADI_3g21705v3 [Brachypodium distachyon]|uniref:Uncharacterized protein n=1 Tax=Brachypodium distachyon TaxID=15368 RepID=A0A0Q3JD22_BRADI|nr:hypothetical protein BRADI_3g21705v3 [Brachypodium distachyon]
MHQNIMDGAKRRLLLYKGTALLNLAPSPSCFAIVGATTQVAIRVAGIINSGSWPVPEPGALLRRCSC